MRSLRPLLAALVTFCLVSAAGVALLLSRQATQAEQEEPPARATAAPAEREDAAAALARDLVEARWDGDAAREVAALLAPWLAAAGQDNLAQAEKHRQLLKGLGDYPDL